MQTFISMETRDDDDTGSGRAALKQFIFKRLVELTEIRAFSP